MRAIVLREFGPPEMLRLEDVASPVPAVGEVLVEVRAVSVNRTLDLKVRRGEYGKSVALPLVLGADPSGVIAGVGAGVTRRVGERVTVSSHVRCGACEHCRAGDDADCTASRSIGVHRWGGYAELVAVPERNAYAIPDALGFAEATVLGRHVPAALNLATKAHLVAGEWVLVMGAAGGLGSAGVQVARHLGARVIAAAGSDERVAAAVALGASAGVNYRRDDLTTEVRRITEGHGADVVFENVSDPVLWPKAFAALASHGRLVTMGSHGGDGRVTLDVTRLYLNRLRVIGAAGANRRDIERALREAATGAFRPLIDRVLPLAEAASAHRLLEEGSPLGKLILDPTR